MLIEDVNHDFAVRNFLTSEDLSSHPLQHVPIRRSSTGSATTSGMTPTASRSLNIPIDEVSTATLPLDHLDLLSAKDVSGIYIISGRNKTTHKGNSGIQKEKEHCLSLPQLMFNYTRYTAYHQNTARYYPERSTSLAHTHGSDIGARLDYSYITCKNDYI